MAAVKVSVVVPTYCPGGGLDRLVGSLDRQSLPAEEFEVIFVDDGSPDDTYERLVTLARSHPNYVLRRIENSGWPSRPRNIGLDLAQGEYVLFMDHDDYLYPDALRSAHAFAVAQRADVLSAKETRTSELFAYEGVFRGDVTGDQPKTPGRYGPWTTHKLFRRRFLQDHDIRFREGRRALFEDVLVGISAYVHAERIAVLASQPFYQWVHSPGSNYSSTYGRDVGEYLSSIAGIIDHAEQEAAGGTFAAWMRGYQYRLRILGQLLGPGLLSRAAEDRADVVGQIRAFMDQYAPPSLDDGLNPVLAARAQLVRCGDVDGLVALARADRGVKPIPVATRAEWDDDGALHVAVEVRWQDHSGKPLALRRDGDRLLRVLPDDVPPLSDHLLDVTDGVSAATAHLTITDRDKTGWPTVCSPPQTAVEELGRDRVTPVTRFEAVINRAGSELGRPLQSGVWDIACRAGLNGYGGHRPVQFDQTGQIRGEGATVSTAHANTGGHLAMRLGANAPAVFWVGELQRSRASMAGRRHTATVHIPVDGARFTGSAELPMTAVFVPRGAGASEVRHQGRLVVNDGRAHVELPADLPRGHYETRVEVPGRAEPIDLRVGVTAGRLGKVSVRSARS